MIHEILDHSVKFFKCCQRLLKNIGELIETKSLFRKMNMEASALCSCFFLIVIFFFLLQKKEETLASIFPLLQLHQEKHLSCLLRVAPRNVLEIDDRVPA